MRLINGDALIEAGKNTSEFQQNLANEYDLECLVAGMPTISPDSLVKRGRWSFKYDPEKDPKRYFVRIVCSECNLHTGQVSNYCPKCGAKMDESGEEEDL